MYQPVIWSKGIKVNWSPIPPQMDPRDVLLAWANKEIEIEIRPSGLHWRRALNEQYELGL